MAKVTIPLGAKIAVVRCNGRRFIYVARGGNPPIYEDLNGNEVADLGEYVRLEVTDPDTGDVTTYHKADMT